MSKVEQIRAEIAKLSPAEQHQILDWLEDRLEDPLELTDEFIAKIEQGKRDLAEGKVRIHRPVP